MLNVIRSVDDTFNAQGVMRLCESDQPAHDESSLHSRYESLFKSSKCEPFTLTPGEFSQSWGFHLRICVSVSTDSIAVAIEEAGLCCIRSIIGTAVSIKCMDVV